MALKPLERRRRWSSVTAAVAVTVLILVLLPLLHFDDTTVLCNLAKNSQSFTYVITCMTYGIMMSCMAEVIRRVCIFCEEIQHLQSRYDGKTSKLLRASFGVEGEQTVFLIPVTAAAVVFAYLFGGFESPSFVQLFCTRWTLCIVAAFSTISYLFGLREPTKAELSDSLERNSLNVGHGLAWSYYYGYLRLIVPDFRERMQKWKEDQGLEDCKVSLKLYILLPKNCFCPPSLHEADQAIAREGHPKSFFASRAGCVSREYKNTVYSIDKDQENKTTYFCVAEFATPLHSLYEMCEGAEAQLSQDEKVHQMKVFHATLNNILKTRPDLEESCSLLPYDDRTPDGKGVRVSSILKTQIDLDLDGEEHSMLNKH